MTTLPLLDATAQWHAAVVTAVSRVAEVQAVLTAPSSRPSVIVVIEPNTAEALRRVSAATRRADHARPGPVNVSVGSGRSLPLNAVVLWRRA